MEQQKGWAIPLLLAVGASCYTAVQSLSARYRNDVDDAAAQMNAGPRAATGKRRAVMDNPYNRNTQRDAHPPSQNIADNNDTSNASNNSNNSKNLASPRALNGCSRGTNGSNGNRGGVSSPSPRYGSADEQRKRLFTAHAGGASVKPMSSALVGYFNPTDANPEAFYSSTSIDARSMTPLGIRGSYQVRLGPLRVVVRPGYSLESDDYRFPLQCYRYRHTDGSLLTLMAEECTAVGWPMSTSEYTARSIDATRDAAERTKAYFKVNLNVPSGNVVTTVMETYVNLHIGPVPIVVASFFLVSGSMALTIQLQAHVAQYRDRMSDLFATVQNARLDDLAARQFTMVSRGGQCTYALRGPTFSVRLSLPTSLSISALECTEENLKRNTDAEGNIAVARVLHRPSPRWEARVVIRPQSKWRLVQWLRQAHTARARLHSDPLTTDLYEFTLVPEMASLVLDQDTVTDLAAVTAMIEALQASGALFMEVPPTAPGVPSQRAIGWLPPSRRESGQITPSTGTRDAAAGDWQTPSMYFPRYESVYWSLPLPSPQLFEARVCEHAGDNAVTLFVRPAHGSPSDMFELEPMLLHCRCGDKAGRGGCDTCVDHFTRRSAALFVAPADLTTFPNNGGETCVIVEGLSYVRPQCMLRLAAIHVCSGEDCRVSPRLHAANSGSSVHYWVVYRWLFSESKEMTRELRQYEHRLLQSGRPR